MPSRTLALVSCSILFIMMLLTFVDVTGRYIFNSPLPALHEIISFMMPGLIFCILPLVCSKEEHVTIDLLDAFVPKRVKRLQAIFVNLISSGAMFFLAWRLAEKSATHFEYGEVTDDLYLILWPFSLLIAALSAIAAIALLSNTFNYIFDNRKSYEKLEQE
jgi:TRAP-type C4-dicarboxylate transport system permease small subunit